MSTKVTAEVLNTAEDIQKAVNEAFKVPDGTAVRVGVKQGRGRTKFDFSATRYSKGWSVREGRKVTSRYLEDAVVQDLVSTRVSQLVDAGNDPEKVVVVGHRREQSDAE